LRGFDLGRLPGALEEARLISRLHGVDGLQVLIGFDATRDAVMARLPGVRTTLHFGTHGVAGTSSLGESGLVLTQFNREGRALDGFVSASEIAAQRVRADLVVVAACDSASGVVVSGEAALGVAYAFTLAGARQVIGAAWPVADSATYALMDAFYTGYYRDRLGASAALRRAQRMLLDSPRWRDPRYWAAFQISGGPGG
jgi:CHAT domain-containing protein